MSSPGEIQHRPQPSTAVVELENSTWVVERGVRHTEWFVKIGAVWARAADMPEAVALDTRDDAVDPSLELAERPPGCQYLCRVRLTLPIGTELKRRVSSPRSVRRRKGRGGAPVGTRDLRRDILSFFRYVKPPLTVKEMDFRVTRRGIVSAERRDRRLVSGPP